ncbi:MAG: DUF4381 family protein [Verrucomicrobiota bacterium]
MQKLPLYEDLEFLIPPMEWTWLWWVAGAALLCSIGIAWYFFKMSQKPRVGMEEKYLKILSQLRLEKSDSYTLMTKVSQVLRVYIEEKFRIAATKQTTREFLNTLRKENKIRESHRALLDEFLNEADLIKFARKQQDSDRMNQLHAAAVKFVTETRS